MPYFNECYTPDELHAKYRQFSKKLHPDMGGNKSDFQDMQNEYEQRKINILFAKHDKLPDHFSCNGIYEYFRKSVKYVGVDYGHYYKFIQQFGADILIDINHINLIFVKHKTIC